MKNDINLLGDSFAQKISECKQEEDSTRKIRKEYEETLLNLCINNQKRAKAINEIRLKKIQEINDELEKSNLELKELQERSKSILYAYCERNGHKDFLISSKSLGMTGGHSFSCGFEQHMRFEYKCTVCRRERTYTGIGYANYSFTKSKRKYEQKIPDDVYDDKSLTDGGKTFRMIQEEIFKINHYINYLESLKQKLCELFGHDAKNDYYAHFKCECCGQYMSYEEYIDAHYNAKYRGIVDFYYDDPEKDYITSADEKLDFSLPTFEDYLKDLELSEKDNPKKLIKKI